MAHPFRPSPKAIALWRHEHIAEALATRSPDVRGPLVTAQSRVPVIWPSGASRPISVATLYRWISLCEEGGLDALRPARRKDAGKPRARLPDDVVERAFALLADDPEISFTFLLALLRADPSLNLQRREVGLSRSTLQRRLAANPTYRRLKRARAVQRQRGRFVGRQVHDLWHLDAKGPVTIRLTSGEQFSFHVLTVLDSVSRAVLAVHIALSPDLPAAVRVFRSAAMRWGLPNRIYADRASIFDSVAFRTGLAQLGVNRIFVRSRNPEANGKIEAYHRTLAGWFTKRLKRQQVIDIEHLQQLLDGFVEALYQDHHHRGLKTTPRQELADRTSSRQVAAARLEDAFREERILKAHPKTGEIDLRSGTWLVPEGLRGQRLAFLLDPEPQVVPLVIEPGSGRRLPLTRAAVRVEDCPGERPPIARWGQGPLQTLYDSWQGKIRPVAEAGFGLPEVFTILSEVAGRAVPRSDAEAALIQQTWSTLGPLPRTATEAAFRAIRKSLGQGRPVKAYLDALGQRLRAAQSKERCTKP